MVDDHRSDKKPEGRGAARRACRHSSGCSGRAGTTVGARRWWHCDRACPQTSRMPHHQCEFTS